MPAAKKRGRPPAQRHTEDYKRVGKAPADPLKTIEWAGQLLAVAMEKIAADEHMTERLRRQELRATAKVMVSLVPTERLSAAEETVRRAHEDQARTDADPGLKDVSTKSAHALRADPD